MSAVSYEKRGDVVVLTIDNPPVNGLAQPVRHGLAEGMAQGLADDAVKAFVIIGGGRMFSAGADIREFGTEGTKIPPQLPDVCRTIEGAPKPVVAAIHGTAAGGGLELALSCHVRMATKSTRVGLPEVTLGIIPGSGGTQRLPRLTGIKAALDMIVGGRLIPAPQAMQHGVIDYVVEGELIDAAVDTARKLAADGTIRRTNELDDKLAEARGKPEVFEEYKKGMARSARGYEAPWVAVDCVEAAVDKPFDEGMQFERDAFAKLVVSDQSRALRHAFFAEREVTKIPDVPRETQAAEIRLAAVIGCGTMGGGIAMNFANAGIPVIALELERDALDRGLAIIRKNYAATVAKGRLKQEDMDKRMALITGTTRYEDLAEADIIIEAVFEDMKVKKEVFSRLDAVAKPGAVLATNTSTLDVDEIAAATKRPEAVIGTHFFSPANVMRLMENVRGEKTSKETIATVMKLSRTIGKVGVLVGVCFGFVGNRMLYAYTRQANFLLEEGALPQQVDKAIYDFGFPMGPFQMGDLAGLDVGYLVRQAHPEILAPEGMRYSSIGDRIAESGRHGQKTNAGWYLYEEGSRSPKPDPEIEKLIVETSRELGIERREISTEEIIERCMFPLVNEGAKILEEGLALRASDIDVVWLYGYGFPRYRGGPMFWADTVGVNKIYDTMSRLYDQHGEWLKPAPLLERLAREGKGFGDL